MIAACLYNSATDRYSANANDNEQKGNEPPTPRCYRKVVGRNVRNDDGTTLASEASDNGCYHWHIGSRRDKCSTSNSARRIVPATSCYDVAVNIPTNQGISMAMDATFNFLAGPAAIVQPSNHSSMLVKTPDDAAAFCYRALSMHNADISDVISNGDDVQ